MEKAAVEVVDISGKDLVVDMDVSFTPPPSPQEPLQNNLEGFEWLEGEWRGTLSKAEILSQMYLFCMDYTIPDSEYDEYEDYLEKNFKGLTVRVILSYDHVQYCITSDTSTDIKMKYPFGLSGNIDDLGRWKLVSGFLYVDGEILFGFADHEEIFDPMMGSEFKYHPRLTYTIALEDIGINGFYGGFDWVVLDLERVK
ncbi:MAG: hypothetical protein J5769_05460 [Bacteroidales bacterium]|nr:hypothetical protein [Bacteroidales bacterium]